MAYGAIHYGHDQDFRDKEIERLFNREPVKRFREIERAARRKLEMVDAAEILDNLRFPPGNHIEALRAVLQIRRGFRPDWLVWGRLSSLPFRANFRELV